ncbi:NRDE protein-domain-containing protein [Cokeromyces recurvatus]|uniref:NRDE protein-domain-containing protein n=1 Tax=Cokeromyces recurvatus TaxID=90255 RepID=UPI00221FD474|nr:NRDE protein-domain-containing protein [Cokeromyces recurvatus]KAI7897937.1 NRDE protein-domain-containing protein [Cokeromyces recurvatus]
MCILFWTVDNHPKYRFIFASNRDEFLKRPTARAHFWDEPHQNVLAGIDLEFNSGDQQLKNGTWLGITRQGRFSALTNYREQNFRGSISRGVLVRDFLWSSDSVHACLDNLYEHRNDYGGFNLIHFDFSKDPVEMAYLSNRENQNRIDLKPGEIYGISNSVLNNPWTKVIEGKKLFENIIKKKPMTNVQDMQRIFDDLKERICIPLFEFPECPGVKDLSYATRTSTIVLIDYDNNVTFIERLWRDENDLTLFNPENYNDVIYHFKLEK